MTGGIEQMWLATAQGARALVDAGRDPFAPIEQLSALYRRLDAEDASRADRIIATDLTSSDSGIRYDALWLINEFAITSALPALRQLAERLAASSDVGAPFEREKVDRIIGQLESAGDTP